MILRPGDWNRAGVLSTSLIKFDTEVEELIGIRDEVARAVLVEQIVESLRRIKFAHFIRDGKIDPRRADPYSSLFDPLRAAVFMVRKGELDEAFWLIFLSTHF